MALNGKRRIEVDTEGSIFDEFDSAVDGVRPGMGMVQNAAGAGIFPAANPTQTIHISREDALQGKVVYDPDTPANHTTDTGGRIFSTIPALGRRVNLRVKAGENVTRGNKLTLEANTGLWVVGAGPYEAMETLTDPAEMLVTARRVA